MGKNYYFANVTARGYPGSTVLHSSTRGAQASLFIYRQVDRILDTHMPQLLTNTLIA